MTPRATYRLQFHRDFTFADARALVPYLRDLGVSHVYASPVTRAVKGSTHGYDVTDPTVINPELGGEDGFRELVATLRRHGMGLVIDIVPNHMGVGTDENPWWNDVLRHGRDSRFARFFDIDWDSGPLLLPLLGGPLEQALAQGDVALAEWDGEPAIRLYGNRLLPLRPDVRAQGADLLTLLDRQHYRLCWWRVANDELNWRRFFTISDLAGLRVEDEQVFETTHALYFRLHAEGLIDGLRIDHIDGLTDPAAYGRRLRARLDGLPRPPDAPPGPAWIVVEKILGAGEHLPEDWGVDGTSGYDFMEQAAALLHDPAGEAPLTALWQEMSGRPGDFGAEELRARQDMLAWAFEGQLHGCVRAFQALAQSAPSTRCWTAAMLRRALTRLLWSFPVYRTYGTGKDAPPTDAPVREAVRARAARFTPPGEADVSDRILDWLAGDGPGEAGLKAEAVRRFQQLSAPIAAKAVEDTAFYRHGRLLSRTDVGFDPARFAMPVAEFHAACAQRAARFPAALLATATHDHKRGEDARARLAVLSAIPGAWTERVRHWENLAGDKGRVDAADRYMIYQTLYGSWPYQLDPRDAAGLCAYAERLAAWSEKALREAKLRSSWEQPDTGYETQCRGWIMGLLDPARSAGFLSDLTGFVARTAGATLANMLAQTALRCLVPGVPDSYQGTELPDFSLVDPDNRRPVDYGLRQTMLMRRDGAHPKLRLLHGLLTLRRDHAGLFAGSHYAPVHASGPRADRIVAFRRSEGGSQLRCAILIRCGGILTETGGTVPPPDWWEDTQLHFAGDTPVPAAELFAGSPVFAQVSRA